MADEDGAAADAAATTVADGDGRTTTFLGGDDLSGERKSGDDILWMMVSISSSEDEGCRPHFLGGVDFLREEVVAGMADDDDDGADVDDAVTGDEVTTGGVLWREVAPRPGGPGFLVVCLVLGRLGLDDLGRDAEGGDLLERRVPSLDGWAETWTPTGTNC